MAKTSTICYIILIIGALIGTNFPIAPGVYWTDVICALLCIICVWKLVHKRWTSDLISNFTLGYIIILAFSSFANQTFLQTQFINYFRIFTCGWIVYVVLKNEICTKMGLRLFGIVFILYSLYFLFHSRDLLFQSMSIANSFHSLDFGIGRNNWGFTNLMHLIFISFLLYKVELPKLIKVLAYCQYPFLIFNIYFSASRFALITLVGFVIFFRLWMRKGISFKEGIVLILLVLMAPIMLTKLESSIGSDFLQGSKHVFESKIGNTKDEVMSMRLYGLNIEPIERFVASPSTEIGNIIIGDGLSITHGILSHIFIVTGVIGFIYFFAYSIYLMKHYIKSNRIGIFIAVVMLIMLLNDIMTNARFIIYVNNLIFMIILAFLAQYCKINENNRIPS